VPGTKTADKSEQTASDRSVLGSRLREERQRRGIGVRELGRQTDCSASLISQIELGKIAPSVSTLYALTNSLGVSMDSLFVTDGAQGAAPVPAPEPRLYPVAEPAPGEKGIVQRRHNRPHITLQHGVRWERLNPEPESGAEFLEVSYEAGGGYASDDEAVRHNGREYGLVLEGMLSVQVGFETYVLEAGDSIAFDSTIPHRYWNNSNAPVRAIWFELKPEGSPGADGPQPASVHSFH
jgi:transcriptional regulator with XRE-family HTH domain